MKRIRPLSYGISIPCSSWCRCVFLSCSRIRTVICVCANTVKKPLSQAEREMSFAARSARTSLMSTNQGKRRKETLKGIYQIVQHYFLRPALDAVHLLQPAEPVIGFKLLRYSLFLAICLTSLSIISLDSSSISARCFHKVSDKSICE